MTTTQQAAGVRVPPHSIEAEESVLGAMLLSEASVSDVLDRIRGDDFYKPGHRRIFDAVVSLFGRGEAIDSVTVAEELRRGGRLEEVGGKPYLFHLVNSVPAASNASYYARIVEETALLRRLIEATQQAAAMAFESGEDADHIVDSVEQLIFSVASKRLGDNFKHIREMLHDQLAHIEALQERGASVTGVPTGFVDLDNLTSGFQPSNLVIVAARPSFGKTSLALNIAQQAATEHNVPVAIFSLEMSRTELVQRLVCAEALVDVHKLRRGNLSDQDWSRLATAVGRLADAPIFIDDTESVTVLEIRAKARRLKQKSGLGLVIIDYLQLMSGPRRSENRQQEISEISRSLKILARELEVPVIAVSQLSRAVEARQDKRPMLADLRECVTGDTLVCLADGRRVPIAGLVGTTPRVLAMSTDGKVVEARSDKVWRVGTRPVFRLRLASGRSIRATGRHRLYAASGWERVDALGPGDRIAIARKLPEPADAERWPDTKVALLGQMIGDGSYLSGRPMRYTTNSSDDAWLRELGIFGQRSHEKRIPEAAFRLPDDQIALLLRHLCATDPTMHYSTDSPGMANDVAALLLRLGIVARTLGVSQGRHQPQYSVHVSGSAARSWFPETVGALRPRSVEPRTNVDTAPKALFDRGEGATRCATLPDDPGLREIATSALFWDRIVAVQPEGSEEVFDLTVPGPASWLADGVVNHNSGAIEQDSDVVLFIYRDEVYNPDSTDKGTAEILLAKHRNGPVGRLKLTFLENYTKFANHMGT